MKKKIIILTISTALLISACNHAKNADSNQSIENTYSLEIQEKPNGETTNDSSFPESNTENYNNYSGIYTDDSKDNASLSVSIDNKNHLTGNIFHAPNGHESEIDFDTHIENDTAKYSYTEDGWGGKGTLVFEFLDNQINIKVEDHITAENNSIGYGIQGEYTFRIIDPRLVQYSSLDKYDSSWSEDQIIDETYKRSKYIDNCNFWNEVVNYWENTREVRDIANIYTYLFHSDTIKYTKSDLENEPKLILNLGKNEIYARHGYIFKDENIENYFLGQIWYVPTTFPEDFDDSSLSEIEKENLVLFSELSQ
ncbi:YARHG domain-containing protein [Pseudobutyrivibrio ruminis]|uniref:YARHG domain-containing protein n=1 Tax=Pseudobutyrivibrio ruminis TaxID=46206 RepID=A0A2G3DXR1_9FIRM|nr:YARHG domain-containing protein [Pseudobutyrivibrio ruminis]PHU35645.1 hypothetical protein CSX01_03325 [Pseudobutyrivibrio ruminis]